VAGWSPGQSLAPKWGCFFGPQGALEEFLAVDCGECHEPSKLLAISG
jgi:hypothetical protein